MVENSIRPLAIGRKNYLFCGDDDAAQRAAIVYSLLATCKAHGVDERTWLEDVLRRMPEYELGQKDFSDLLPEKWSASGTKLVKPTSHQYKRDATGISVMSVASHFVNMYFFVCLQIKSERNNRRYD